MIYSLIWTVNFQRTVYTKMHYEITSKEINSVTSSAVIIKDVRKQHIIAFHPDGRIYVKENICSWYERLHGDLLNCQFEPGIWKLLNRLVMLKVTMRMNQKKAKKQSSRKRGNLVLEMIECNSFITIFSPPNSSELFYICKVLDFDIADHQLEDEFNMLFLKATNL